MKLFPLVSSLFSYFRTAPSGFGSAGIRRQRECGAIIIVGDFDGQYGCETDETGISIENWECEYKPFVNDRLLSNVGEPRARAVSDKFSRNLRFSGEITGADGVMAFTLGTACSMANDSDTFGAGEGDFLLDSVRDVQARATWRKAFFELSSDPYVAV